MLLAALNSFPRRGAWPAGVYARPSAVIVVSAANVLPATRLHIHSVTSSAVL